MAQVPKETKIGFEDMIVEDPDVKGISRRIALAMADAVVGLRQGMAQDVELLGTMYRRGMVTAKGDVTEAGEAFCKRWKGRLRALNEGKKQKK